MSVPLTFSVEYSSCVPVRCTVGSAGFDLRSAKREFIDPFSSALVSSGIRVEIPCGHFGMLTLRSGFAFENSAVMPNAPGIIDADYRGVVYVPVLNLGGVGLKIEAGERIAQLTVVPSASVEVFWVDKVGPTERGEGGFGSTGR